MAVTNYASGEDVKTLSGIALLVARKSGLNPAFRFFREIKIFFRGGERFDRLDLPSPVVQNSLSK